MAEEIIKRLIDDLDGSEASQTHIIALNGSAVRIDLSDANTEKLMKDWKKWMDAGTPAQSPARSVTPIPKAGKAGGTRKRQSNYDASKGKMARAYFSENQDKLPEGQKLPGRGRTPQPIVDAWEALGSPGL